MFKKSRTLVTCFCILLYLYTNSAYADSFIVENTSASNIDYVNIEKRNDDFLTNINGDAQIILSGFNESRADMCSVVLEIEFEKPLDRAAVFDVYWRTQERGYSEKQKALFLINQSASYGIQQYVLPLCQLYDFSGNVNSPQLQHNITGLRLDYPSNIDLSLRLHYVGFFSQQAWLNKQVQGAIEVELYESNSGAAFTSMDVVLPKFFMAIKDGWNRFTVDIAFFIFLVFLIIAFCLVIFRKLFFK